MQKKNKKIVIEQQNSDLKNMIKPFVIVVAAFIIIYILTSFITGEVNLNKKNKKTDITPAYIQYKEILAGETFDMNDTEYYVLFYDFSEGNNVIKGIIQNYESKENKIKLYTVNTDNNFNKGIKSEISNSLANNVAELKVKNNTLIKISNKNNVLYIEGITAIQNQLAN
jgi:hypothetical protein